MPVSEAAKKHWFTPAIAREMAARGNASRWSRSEKLPEHANGNTRIAETDPLTKDTLAQIKDLDKEYAKATDLADKLKIAGIKEKLWRLIIPSPGSLKPKAPKSGRSTGPPIEPESA